MSDTGLTSLRIGADVFAENNDFAPGWKDLPVYADNAAAIAGGLVPGQLFRTAGTDTVKVVHLPEYANNAAAVAAGLSAGDVYLNSGDDYKVYEVE